MANISQIPLSKVPFLDDKSGLVSREWYRFLNNLFGLTGGGGSDLSLSDVQVGPATVYTDQTAELHKEIDGLGTAPTYTPHVDQSKIGDFYDTTNQTAAAINTAYAATINTTNFSKGIQLGTPTSRITVLAPGYYGFDAVVQVGRPSGGGGVLKAWLRKNGVDLTGSATTLHVPASASVSSLSFIYVVSLAANDYIEIIWAVSDTGLRLESTAASAPYPLVPSVHVSMHNVTG